MRAGRLYGYMTGGTTEPVKTVCVYCGSGNGVAECYFEAARELSAELAARGIAIVYGGARVGLMGMVADTALSLGASVTGVIPEGLVQREIAHEGLTQQYVVSTMHERKEQMASLSDAFIALPGGLGTLEELFEIMTWGHLGIHAKPFGLVNTGGYYNQLIRFLEHAVREGFIGADRLEKLLVSEQPQQLLDRFP